MGSQDNVADLQQRQRLDEEDKVVTFEVEDIRSGLDKCGKNLLGRILADRLFSSGTMESALFTIWVNLQVSKFKIMERWQEGVTIEERDFAIVPLWIQFWGLLEHCKTKELGQKIGSSMGEVLEVESFHIRGNDEKIMKA
ncbi:hypothetical protein PIB30_066482 [Stylosanthes scabra]|uniref:DUF4283 domain-containing protein n=1 Tax=Stylosanthes scabra TaxID=79078 RepID=A0ABU6ZL39_9FABA|nr:hypothetical protein [Stylosanthes scabra]